MAFLKKRFEVCWLLLFFHCGYCFLSVFTAASAANGDDDDYADGNDGGDPLTKPRREFLI